MRPNHLLLAAVALAALGSCARQSGSKGTAPPGPGGTQATLAAVVSIPPQAYLVERVGGGLVSVQVLVAPGQSPHTYEATPSQMAALERADVYFSIGVPFEKALLRKIGRSMPGLNVVDTRQGIRLRAIEAPSHGAVEAHGDAGEAQGAPDPHFWLDPRLAKTQARTMRDALARLDPSHRAVYDRNLAALEGDLDRVHSEIAARLAPVQGREMVVLHPAYGYFAAAYGLKQVALEVEGKEPSARQLAQTIERIRQARVRAVFVQPESSTATAEAIADEIGCEVVRLDPLARDYTGNLREMAEKVRASLMGPPAGGGSE